MGDLLKALLASLSHFGKDRRDRIHDTPNAIALCILDLGQKNYQIQSMSTYNEVLSQIHSLTSDEQLRLLEELAALVRQKVTSEHQRRLPEIQRVSKDKWRGFLPKRVDALEFQRSLRQEWGE
jgi:hypothetical protein